MARRNRNSSAETEMAHHLGDTLHDEPSASMSRSQTMGSSSSFYSSSDEFRSSDLREQDVARWDKQRVSKWLQERCPALSEAEMEHLLKHWHSMRGDGLLFLNADNISTQFDLKSAPKLFQQEILDEILKEVEELHKTQEKDFKHLAIESMEQQDFRKRRLAYTNIWRHIDFMDLFVEKFNREPQDEDLLMKVSLQDIPRVKRLYHNREEEQRYALEAIFEGYDIGRQAIFFWASSMQYILERPLPCKLSILNHVAENIPAAVGVKLLWSYKSELARLSVDEVDRVCRHIIMGCTSQISACLVVASFLYDRGEFDLSRKDGFRECGNRFVDCALTRLNDIYSDHMATVTLEAKSEFEGKSPLTIAVDLRIMRFLKNSRIERIMDSMMMKWNFLTVEERESAFLLTVLSTRYLAGKIMSPRFYFTGIGRFTCEFVLYILYLVIFTHQTRQREHPGSPFTTAEAVFWVANIGYILHEINEAWNDRSEYFDSWENYLDSTISINFMFLLCVRVYGQGVCVLSDCGPDPFGSVAELFQVLWGLNALLLYVRFTFFFILSDNLGPMLRMIFNMFTDIWAFVKIMAVIFVGFMYCLMFLVGADAPAFKDEVQASLNLFRALVGDTAIFDAAKGISLSRQYVFFVLIVTYMTLSTIILLNLLIAMMGKTYESIYARTSEEVNFNRVRLMFHLLGTTHTLPPPMNLPVLIISKVIIFFDEIVYLATRKVVNLNKLMPTFMARSRYVWEKPYLTAAGRTIPLQDPEQRNGRNKENEEEKNTKEFNNVTVTNYNWLLKRVYLKFNKPMAFEAHILPKETWEGQVEYLFREQWIDLERWWDTPANEPWMVNRIYRDQWRLKSIFQRCFAEGGEKVDEYLKSQWRCYYCRQIAAPSVGTITIYGLMLKVRESDLDKVSSFSPTICPTCYRAKKHKRRSQIIEELVSYYLYWITVFPLICVLLFLFMFIQAFVSTDNRNPNLFMLLYELFEKCWTKYCAEQCAEQCARCCASMSSSTDGVDLRTDSEKKWDKAVKDAVQKDKDDVKEFSSNKWYQDHQLWDADRDSKGIVHLARFQRDLEEQVIYESWDRLYSNETIIQYLGLNSDRLRDAFGDYRFLFRNDEKEGTESDDERPTVEYKKNPFTLRSDFVARAVFHKALKMRTKVPIQMLEAYPTPTVLLRSSFHQFMKWQWENRHGEHMRVDVNKDGFVLDDFWAYAESGDYVTAGRKTPKQMEQLCRAEDLAGWLKFEPFWLPFKNYDPDKPQHGKFDYTNEMVYDDDEDESEMHSSSATEQRSDPENNEETKTPETSELDLEIEEFVREIVHLRKLELELTKKEEDTYPKHYPDKRERTDWSEGMDLLKGRCLFDTFMDVVEKFGDIFRQKRVLSNFVSDIETSIADHGENHKVQFVHLNLMFRAIGNNTVGQLFFNTVNFGNKKDKDPTWITLGEIQSCVHAMRALKLRARERMIAGNASTLVDEEDFFQMCLEFTQFDKREEAANTALSELKNEQRHLGGIDDEEKVAQNDEHEYLKNKFQKQLEQLEKEKSTLKDRTNRIHEHIKMTLSRRVSPVDLKLYLGSLPAWIRSWDSLRFIRASLLQYMRGHPEQIGRRVRRRNLERVWKEAIEQGRSKNGVHENDHALFPQIGSNMYAPQMIDGKIEKESTVPWDKGLRACLKVIHELSDITHAAFFEFVEVNYKWKNRNRHEEKNFQKYLSLADCVQVLTMLAHFHSVVCEEVTLTTASQYVVRPEQFLEYVTKTKPPDMSSRVGWTPLQLDAFELYTVVSDKYMDRVTLGHVRRTVRRMANEIRNTRVVAVGVLESTLRKQIGNDREHMPLERILQQHRYLAERTLVSKYRFVGIIQECRVRDLQRQLYVVPFEDGEYIADFEKELPTEPEGVENEDKERKTADKNARDYLFKRAQEFHSSRITVVQAVLYLIGLCRRVEAVRRAIQCERPPEKDQEVFEHDEKRAEEDDRAMDRDHMSEEEKMSVVFQLKKECGVGSLFKGENIATDNVLEFLAREDESEVGKERRIMGEADSIGTKTCLTIPRKERRKKDDSKRALTKLEWLWIERAFGRYCKNQTEREAADEQGKEQEAVAANTGHFTSRDIENPFVTEETKLNESQQRKQTFDEKPLEEKWVDFLWNMRGKCNAALDDLCGKQSDLYFEFYKDELKDLRHIFNCSKREILKLFAIMHDRDGYLTFTQLSAYFDFVVTMMKRIEVAVHKNPQGCQRSLSQTELQDELEMDSEDNAEFLFAQTQRRFVGPVTWIQIHKFVVEELKGSQSAGRWFRDEDQRLGLTENATLFEAFAEDNMRTREMMRTHFTKIRRDGRKEAEAHDHFHEQMHEHMHEHVPEHANEIQDENRATE